MLSNTLDDINNENIDLQHGILKKQHSEITSNNIAKGLGVAIFSKAFAIDPNE